MTANNIPAHLLTQVTFNQTIGVQPKDFLPNMKEIALNNLKTTISQRESTIQVKDVTCIGKPSIVPGKGTVNYRCKVTAMVFEPKVGMVLPARVLDLNVGCVLLKALHILCFLPSNTVTAKKGKMDVLQKTFYIDGGSFTIGSTVNVRIESIKSDLHQTKAIVSFV